VAAWNQAEVQSAARRRDEVSLKSTCRALRFCDNPAIVVWLLHEKTAEPAAMSSADVAELADAPDSK
jgi:hypothetical protein